LTPARTAPHCQSREQGKITTPHCQSREQGDGTTRSETKQDHQSRQYRMIIRTRSRLHERLLARKKPIKVGQRLDTRKRNLGPQALTGPHIGDSSTAQSSAVGGSSPKRTRRLAYGWWPRRAHSVDVIRRRPGCGPCRANSPDSEPLSAVNAWRPLLNCAVAR
jgi:hypothetical protein